MPDRASLAVSFLSDAGWAGAFRASLAGDASNRRYERLTDPVTGNSAVLMDAPPALGEDVRPFARIARHLCGLGLSAPVILAEDPENGFLLLEDLGDAVFARVIRENPALENTLYRAATDLLLTLHSTALPDLPLYAPDLIVELTSLVFTKYRCATIGDSHGRDEFSSAFHTILQSLGPYRPVLIQRDYHAENLIWLPDRQGTARVGLLDFQDAMAGHPAFDLMSLLQDARRDVPLRVEDEMIRHYLDASGLDAERFRAAYAVLGVQRNLRILGVFARLARDMGKTHYVDLIPRVWAHLMRDLQHPAMDPVRDLLIRTLPEPTAETLARLKTS